MVSVEGKISNVQIKKKKKRFNCFQGGACTPLQKLNITIR